MRPTDFCHLSDAACIRTSCVPGSLRGFHRVDTPRSLRLRAIYRGTKCFTALVNASADRNKTRVAFASPPEAALWATAWMRAWALSSHGACSDRASDTSVASPSSAECRSAFASPSALLHIAVERIAFPREEAAEAAVTIAS